jgi:ArsR family transcriptional regulator, arsenate/arsenite/antimonite-responsive transcriptional repressor
VAADGGTVLVAEATALRALAHPVRLGIMRYIAQTPETCACDFAAMFGIAQPTASQHLKVLRDAGLVRTRRRGTQICYSVDAAGLTAIQEVLASLRPTPLTSTG